MVVGAPPQLSVGRVHYKKHSIGEVDLTKQSPSSGHQLPSINHNKVSPSKERLTEHCGAGLDLQPVMREFHTTGKTRTVDMSKMAPRFKDQEILY
jgi:hypothetical protein